MLRVKIAHSRGGDADFGTEDFPIAAAAGEDFNQKILNTTRVIILVLDTAG